MNVQITIKYTAMQIISLEIVSFLSIFPTKNIKKLMDDFKEMEMKIR